MPISPQMTSSAALTICLPLAGWISSAFAGPTLPQESRLSRRAINQPVVELPGIEPASLPGHMPSELRFRSVSLRFGPVRYLRFCSRVLTASRAVITHPLSSGATAVRPSTKSASRARNRTIFAATTGRPPSLVLKPSILLGRHDGLTTVDEFEARHVYKPILNCPYSTLRASTYWVAD